MTKKEEIKGTLDVYFNFIRKEDIRNKVLELMSESTFEELKDIITDPKYITAVVKSKDLDMARIFCTIGSIIPTSLFKIAVNNCDIDMLNFLLDVGININEKIIDEEKCYEPLAYLILCYNDKLFEIVEKMLNLGANPNAKIGQKPIIQNILRCYATNNHSNMNKLISSFIEHDVIFDSSDISTSYWAAYYLNLEFFHKLTKGKFNILGAIDGALDGNNIKLIENILENYSKLMPYILNEAIYRNASINMFKSILNNKIPKHQLNSAIVHLRNNKHKHHSYKYKEMLSALKHAKRKAN